MNAQPNYARMKGPGDFSPPADPPEHDDTDIRDTLMTSPTFVEEAIGDDTDWRAVAKAVIDRDAMEVLRLLDVAVQKYADWHIHQAEESFDADPANNRNNPDGETDPFRELEREYGEQLKRTPMPIVSQATADHFNAIMRGDARPANPFSGLLGGAE